jgi:hypothetical protein
MHLYIYIYMCIQPFMSCAGAYVSAYVSGVAGSNACPGCSARIETEAACRTAAAAAGKRTESSVSWSPFVETEPGYPRGCYYDIFNTAYFNTHAVGGGNSNGQLLCAAVPNTGAPLPRRSARARAPARAGMCTGGTAIVRRCSVSTSSVCLCAYTHLYICLDEYGVQDMYIYTYTYTYTYLYLHL